MDPTVLNISAVAAMVPAWLLALRPSPARDAVFWAVLGIAAAAALARVGFQVAHAWQTGFAASLWVSVAATGLLFLITAVISLQAWRLAPFVTGIMLILAVLASVWQSAPGRPLIAGAADTPWIVVHIAVATVTYGLVTIAAAAAVAAFLQQRALKRKERTALNRLLPSVVDCDRIVVGLLLAGEAVLAVGLATGIALQWRETGAPLVFDHKTVLTIAAFVVIGGLLFAHWRVGVRGRQAARLVLFAWLLLTLGYPGVKFVTDVLMA